jgi:hypothetical protein
VVLYDEELPTPVISTLLQKSASHLVHLVCSVDLVGLSRVFG